MSAANLERASLTPGSERDAAQIWQRPETARHAVRDAGGGIREAMLLIDGVRCAGCVATIERAVGATRGVVDISVNAASRRARLRWREPETSLPRLLAALAETGYRALPLDAAALDDVRRHESHAALKRLIVAGFGAMQAMMFAAVLYFGEPASLDFATHELFRWLGFLVATPVVLYAARPFFTGALRSLKSGQPGMDVPVALAVGGIYAASVLEALRGGADVYFESVSMFVFFLLVGRYIEMRARHRAGDLTDALARLAPPFADRRLADGSLERVGARELVVGDRVHVAEGGVIPADGVLQSERCLVDEALLSGESTPALRERGGMLIAGSVLVEGPADLRVERVGAATMLAGMAELVARAQAARPRLAQAGERAASRFVVRMLVVTALTAAGWMIFDPTRAFAAALAVLVVSCPCAFALAVPAAITRAIAVLARRGVLIVKPDVVQALADATHVVFDKTGTLTDAQLTLRGIETRGAVPAEHALELAAALARESRHPAARAIAAAAGTPHAGEAPLLATRVETRPGLGVSGVVAGRALRLGRPDFALGAKAAVAGSGIAAEDTVLLADDDGAIAAFTLTERLRADAAAAVAALASQGLVLSIASGDSPAKVRAIAQRLGIADWRARLLPGDKLAWLEALRAAGERVIAVGDGVNDAPVLGGADVAVALAEGAELAQASSDIVLTGGRLCGLAPARRIAQQALHVLRQNQRWAFCYNFAAVPLAALGFVPPWLAALGMSFSSLVVVLNAMRIGSAAALDRAPALGGAGRSAEGGLDPTARLAP